MLIMLKLIMKLKLIICEIGIFLNILHLLKFRTQFLASNIFIIS